MDRNITITIIEPTLNRVSPGNFMNVSFHFRPLFHTYFFVDGKNIRHVLPVKRNLLNPFIRTSIDSCVQYTLLYSMYSIVLSKVQSSRIHPVNLFNLFFLLYSFYDALKKTPIERYYTKIDSRNFVPMLPKGVDGHRGGLC